MAFCLSSGFEHFFFSASVSHPERNTRHLEKHTTLCRSIASLNEPNVMANRKPATTTQHSWMVSGDTLTCDCKTGFLAQDCTVFVLSEALIEPFIWFVSSSALHLWYIQRAVGEQVHPLALRHAHAVLEPSDVDGRLSVSLTVQDNRVPPHDRDITRLLDEK